MQEYYLRKCDNKTELKDFDKKYGGRGSKVPADMPVQLVEDTPENFSSLVKAHALANEAELVGVTRLNQDWVFEGYQANEPWIVVLGVAMDHDKLAKAPEIESPIEVMTQYNRGTRAARSLSNLIQSLGYHARPHGGPMADHNGAGRFL